MAAVGNHVHVEAEVAAVQLRCAFRKPRVVVRADELRAPVDGLRYGSTAGRSRIERSERVGQGGRARRADEQQPVHAVGGFRAKDHPETLQTWVAQQDRAVKLYRADPHAAAAAVAAELNLPTRRGARADEGPDLPRRVRAGRARCPRRPAREALAATAKFNKELGQIPKTQDDASYGWGRSTSRSKQPNVFP
jgi:ABC-type nitrate/sulfonate/bicarbonate transport system substrate-binding protein